MKSLEIESLSSVVSVNSMGVGFITCEGEVIVQGDEGPVRGVAQVVDCHGVTVSHQEREEEEEQQEVESDGEKTLKGTLRMSMDGMDYGRQVRAA